MTDTRTSIAGAVAMVLVASAVLLAQQSRLRFQSGVEVIPVDVTVAGCPPTPYAIMQGILTAIVQGKPKG